MNKSMNHHSIAALDFKRATLAALAKKGIAILFNHPIPGCDGTFANGGIAYGLNDNGTFRLVSFLEVLSIAKS